MSRMTLTELLTAVRVNVPNQEESAVKQAANLFLRRLARKDLSFTKVRTTITTLTPVETTVTLNKGSSSVTCTDAASTWLGQVALFAGSDQWFSIDTVDAGVGFTISSVFDGDNLAGGDATIAFPRVALGVDVIEVEKVKPPQWSQLGIVSGEVTSFLRQDAKLGTPTAYALVEAVNTSDALELFLVDYPDAVYTYTVIGRNRLTRFAGSTSQCGLPERYEDVLIAGALYYVLTGEDPKGDTTLLWRGEMMAGIDDIRDSAMGGASAQGTLAGADAAGSNLLVARFPADGAS